MGPHEQLAVRLLFVTMIAVVATGLVACGGDDSATSGVPSSDASAAADGPRSGDSGGDALAAADASHPDGSADGGSTSDGASTTDAPTPDGAPSEAGTNDAATMDAASDASTGDSGADGGVPICSCDVTPLCDPGCACDIACSITPGAPPIGSDVVVLDRAEVAAYFPSTSAGPINAVSLFDDAYPGNPAYAPLVTNAARSPISPRPVALASDVDDDGRDEVVLVTATGAIVEDWDGTNLTPRTVQSWPVATFFDGAAGDLDGNGGRNLVVTYQSGNTLTIQVLDVPTSGAATVRATTTLSSVARHAIVIGRPQPGATPWLYVLVGGTGSQGTIESMVVHTFSLSGSTLTEGTPVDVGGQCLIASTPETNGAAIAVGNLDADADSEIAYAFYCGSQLWVRVYEPGSAQNPFVNPPVLYTTSGTQSLGAFRPFLAIGHLGATSLSTPMLALGGTTSGGGGGSVSGPVAFVDVLQIQAGLLRPWASQQLQSVTPYSFLTGLAVRDTDADGTDEIAAATDLVQLVSPLGQPCTSGFGSTCLIKEKGALVEVYRRDFSSKTALVSQMGNPTNAIGPGPVVALGDYDADSTRVRSTGNVYLHTGRPFVNAVIAAPPTWLNKPGVTNVDGSGTSYGYTDSTTMSDSRNVSASASVTASAGVDFAVAKFTASVTASVDVTLTQTTSQQLSYGKETSVGADTDLVSFRAIPYASYEYRVLSHPNPAEIGTLMTIDVPGNMIDTVRTLSDFRAEYGSLASDVLPANLFTHTIGDPTTYPTPANCTQAAIGARIGAGSVSYVYGSPMLVDVGNATSGMNTLSIGVSTETGQSTDVSLNVEMSVGVEAGGVGLEASAGFGGGWSHETTLGHDVTYTGSVGYLSQGYGVTTRYQWGLCAFTYADAASSPKYGSFAVVDYVVLPY